MESSRLDVGERADVADVVIEEDSAVARELNLIEETAWLDRVGELQIGEAVIKGEKDGGAQVVIASET